MLAGLAAFGRFWYRFIVGDDWVIAATVLVTLVVIGLLARAGVQAWWLLPVVVIGVLGVSLWRARRPQTR
jgi:hypothetical protein